MSYESLAPNAPVAADYKKQSIAVEMFILTNDHEIVGTVHLDRQTSSDRRITELLNDTERRFLAITDVQLVSRHGKSSPRLYPFLQLNINAISLIHPTAQSVSQGGLYKGCDKVKFDELREKIIL
ncbi:MAG: hypothetical protein AAGI66_08880 [Cyanobacteria bacterium P01_H01_bin.74]